MSAANPSLVYDADFEEVANQRAGADRRCSDRRSARTPFDTLFAATLVNQLAPPGPAHANAYLARPRRLAGLAFDVRA
jgi:hypothetical protein